MILLLFSMIVCHVIFTMAIKPTLSILNGSLVAMILETSISDRKFNILQLMHFCYMLNYCFIYSFFVLLPIFLFGYDNNLLFIEFFSKIYLIIFIFLFIINSIIHLYNDNECLVPKFHIGMSIISIISIVIAYVIFVKSYDNYICMQNSFQ